MKSVSTIAALATSVGAGSALAVVRVSGPLAESLAKSAFGKKKIAPRTANFGAYRSVSGKILDECVWVLFKSPRSYTGEDLLEISCHGNPFILKRIIADLFERGCESALPGEFTRRAFLNGKMDLAQAEAVANVISARSESAFNAARRLLSGELGRKIALWNEEILTLVAETETQIDFSEEEVPPLDAERFRAKIRNLADNLRKTAETARYFSRVNEGIKVVIFGAPNAGKSSLLNALLGSERAIVSEEAGTTRDFISETLTLGPYCIRITDTAGIRDDPDSEIERSGIRKTVACMKTADFLVFVVDSSDSPPALPAEVSEIVSEEKTLVVFSKKDLPPAFDAKNFFGNFESLSLSLLDGNAADAFKKRLKTLVESRNIVPAEDVLIVSERHAEMMRKAEKMLVEAADSAGTVPVEFISSKLRSVMEELSEILGKTDNEDVLDKVFSSFCIGK